MMINFTETWTKLTINQLDVADDAAERFEDAAPEGEMFEVEFGVGSDEMGVPFRYLTTKEAWNQLNNLVESGGCGTTDANEIFIFARFVHIPGF